MPETNNLRQDLALAYRFLARAGMDDLTYTHLSIRIPGEEKFLIHPLGLMFAEVTPRSLVTVDFEGQVQEGPETHINQTGYVIHSAVYRARPDIHAIIHLHTTAGVAVSAMKCGLLPLSQFSFHFYNRLSDHPYNALALDHDRHGRRIGEDLGPSNKAMLLHNHGTMTCGSTMQEAFFYAWYLEQACRVQCAVLQSGQELVMPAPEVCEQAARDMRAFENNLGERDWQALRRLWGNAA